jgi:DNA-binding NarL/FixJ family response regulator
MSHQFQPEVRIMQGIRTEAVRVFIFAPAMLAWGLERIVQGAHPHLEFTGSAASSDAATADWAGADVVVVAAEADADLAFVVRGATESHAKFLVLANSHDAGLCDKAILAGARGVLKMCDAPQLLLKAIEKVDDGELWIDRGATSRIFLEMARQKAAAGNDPEKSKISTLTRRERQTIAAFTSDVSSPAKIIARRLCISEHTLRNHLTSIYNKLDVANRLDLYAYATRHGLTELQ